MGQEGLGSPLHTRVTIIYTLVRHISKRSHGHSPLTPPLEHGSLQMHFANDSSSWFIYFVLEFTVFDTLLSSVHIDSGYPFLVDYFFKWFCEQVSWVFNSRDVVDVNYSLIDTGMDEVESYVNVFHFRMGMWVMCACHSALVVTI